MFILNESGQMVCSHRPHACVQRRGIIRVEVSVIVNYQCRVRPAKGDLNSVETFVI